MMLTSARFVVDLDFRDPRASSLRDDVKIALLTKGKAPALVAMKRSSMENDSEIAGNVATESFLGLLVWRASDVLTSLQSSVVSDWIRSCCGGAPRKKRMKQRDIDRKNAWFEDKPMHIIRELVW